MGFAKKYKENSVNCTIFDTLQLFFCDNPERPNQLTGVLVPQLGLRKIFTGMINAALEGNRPRVNFDMSPSFMRKSGLTKESQIFAKQIKKFH